MRDGANLGSNRNRRIEAMQAENEVSQSPMRHDPGHILRERVTMAGLVRSSAAGEYEFH